MTLKTVEINAPQIRQQTVGGRQEHWQASDLQNSQSSNLGDVLSMQSGVFVKSYGLGSSATTSVRGGSASQTQVLWNGLPVQNPMLGQLDFSLMPVGLVDEVAVSYGGNTASWGSSAIAGAVFLNNKPVDNEGVRVGVRSEVGSFGWWDQQMKIGYGKGNLLTVVRLFHQEADNDFDYIVKAGLPKRTQTNAAIEQNGLLHELYWKPKSNQQLSTQIWLQNTDRQIPPRVVQTRSEANQVDRFIRSTVQWKRIGEKGVLSVRGGVFREEQGYADPLAGVDTDNDFWKGMAEATQVWHFSKKHKLEVGGSHLWLQSAAGAYGQSRTQNRNAAFALYSYKMGNWQLQANLRQELNDGQFVPVVPVLGWQGDAAKWLKIRGKVSRDYRLPTLNDLYWRPGGNPDLKPEQGWSEEVGMDIVFPMKKEAKQLTYSATFFNRNITDWIQWAVVDGQPFYSPHNITKVWSRGIEQRLHWKGHFKKLKMHLRGGYDYVRSTYQEAVEQPRFEKGQQLSYTPEYQWFGGVDLKYANTSLTYQHRYTGKVGTLNFTNVPAYHIGNLHMNYSIDRATWKGRLFFRLENIWDVDYQVIEHQAMPGRHFRTGLEITLLK